MVTLLVQHGADVHAKNSVRRTTPRARAPLRSLRAARCNTHARACTFAVALVWDGAVPRRGALTRPSCVFLWRAQGGYTPLHYASTNGHASAVTALLNLGADVTAKDKVRPDVPPR